MVKFADPKEFVSNPGSPIRIIYSGKYDNDGMVTLEKVGEENTDEKIQAALESTDIATIVAYYNQTGDESVLNRYVPMYEDFTKIPKTLAGFLQLRYDSEKFFDALPSDVKAKFDYNADNFFATAGSENWYKNIDPILPKPEVEPEPKGVSEE